MCLYQILGKGAVPLIEDYLGKPSGQGAFVEASKIPEGLGKQYIPPPVVGKTTPEAMNEYL